MHICPQEIYALLSVTPVLQHYSFVAYWAIKKAFM